MHEIKRALCRDCDCLRLPTSSQSRALIGSMTSFATDADLDHGVTLGAIVLPGLLYMCDITERGRPKDILERNRFAASKNTRSSSPCNAHCDLTAIINRAQVMSKETRKVEKVGFYYTRYVPRFDRLAYRCLTILQSQG